MAAGVKPHPEYPLDGVSLLSVLKNPSRPSNAELYWKMLFHNQQALRAGTGNTCPVEGNDFLSTSRKDQRVRAKSPSAISERLASMRAC